MKDKTNRRSQRAKAATTKGHLYRRIGVSAYGRSSRTSVGYAMVIPNSSRSLARILQRALSNLLKLGRFYADTPIRPNAETSGWWLQLCRVVIFCSISSYHAFSGAERY
jgi:hypothetical protein